MKFTDRIRYFAVDVVYCIAPLLPPKVPYLISNLFYKPTHLKGFSAAVTSICNARCVFCAYPRSNQPHVHMPMNIFKLGLAAWKSEGGRLIDLTPTVGDPLLDPTLIQKIKLAKADKMTVVMTTNAITLSRIYKEIIAAGLNEINFSLPSFDRQIYKEVYGVDRAIQIMHGIGSFLKHNRLLGEPVRVIFRFRNSEWPSRILASKEYQETIAPFLSKRVKVNFTYGYDNWGGTIKPSDMQGIMQLKKQIKSNLPCRALNGISMLPDGTLRACACRFVKGHYDDLVVGHITNGLESARKKAQEIADSFAHGNRPETCQKCTFYVPEKVNQKNKDIDRLICHACAIRLGNRHAFYRLIYSIPGEKVCEECRQKFNVTTELTVK